MCRKTKILLGMMLIVLRTAIPGLTQSTISAEETRHQVGEKATVCGPVVSTRYASSGQDTPTFLNLDKSYPNQYLRWRSGVRSVKVGHPEEAYREERICVTGTIHDYKGVPESVANEPSRIKTQ